MHVGHCRGAVFGDVLSNLLLFNGNKVIKEYYINDFGNQIRNFVESVYLRIREIKHKEKFILRENLYPGEYIKEIANNIIKKIQSNFIIPQEKPVKKEIVIKKVEKIIEKKLKKIDGIIIPKNKPLIVKKERLRKR